MKVSAGATVTLHFSLALKNGEIIDSNFAGKPATFTVGDGNLPPGFEQELLGLEAGAEIERILPPERAFGAVNPANRHRFPAADFGALAGAEAAPIRAGSVVMFKDASGFHRPGVIRGFGKAEIDVDFDHPLAGKEIVFRVAVISVLAPGAQKLAFEQ